MEHTVEKELNVAAAMGDGDIRVVFLNVPDHIIEKLCGEEESRHHIKYFSKREKMIEFTMPLQLHETSSLVGEDMLKKALSRANMLEPLDNIRSTRMRDEIDDEGKEADSAFSWTPDRRPPQASAYWPLIVLEASASESARDLLADCRWWFQHSKGAVRAVVLVESQKNSVRISAYTVGPRQGTVDKRAGEILAELADGEWVFKSEGPIRIPFVTVFQRPPNALAGEQDIELRCSDFVRSARRLKHILMGVATTAEPPGASFPPEPTDEADQVVDLTDLPQRKPRRRAPR
ncbi:hypothetical protein KEM56_006558 [Ascosphaera pollenicola]|nr:hypothetical protein KEM56_006558 [Ascosphaera pollenicola]